MLGDESTAEDLTQDIFMHLQRSLHTYDASRELAPWVFTIATNKVRDHWRSRRHKQALRELSLDDDGLMQPVSADRGPLPALENAELARLLDRAIDELPESMRETLVLRWYERLPFDRIAELLGRNETAIRKRYSRAFEELRRSLSKSLGLHEDGRTA
jgi:RNA polymerase sigma factor (sigma-70 family)